MLPLQVLPTRAALMQKAAERLEEAITDGLTKNGAACAALSGGSTPEPAYELLAARDLDWASVTFALVDERFVPPSDPASNEGMLRRALAGALARGAKLAPMWSNGNPQDAAARANALYAGFRFDIALMGMGADGHTASWFPDAAELSDALDPTSSRTVIALRAPGAAGSEARLSLTLAAVARAENKLLVFAGADKFARFTAAVNEDPALSPIAALARASSWLDTIYAP